MEISRRIVKAGIMLAATLPMRLPAQDTSGVRLANDSVQVHFVQTDLRAVIQSLGRYLPKPVLVGPILPATVTFETPGPVPRSAIASYLRGIVEAQNLEFKEDSTFFRISPKVQDAAVRPLDNLSIHHDTGTVRLFVIRLKHARAADVAATVNQLFGGGGEFSGNRGLSSGTLSDELRRNVVPPAGAQTGPPSSSTNPPSRPSALSGSVTIVPDELTNSLLIRASQADHDVLREAIDQLDIRPLQVLIEVLIVEVRRDRTLSFGTSLLVPSQASDKSGGTASGSVTGAGLGDLVIQLMSLGHAHIDATLAAAQEAADELLCFDR